MGPGLVPGQGGPEGLEHLGPVGGHLHVDEVDDDDPADVAQPELTGHLLGRLQVVLEHGLLEVRAAHVLAGVHVDDGEGFGVLDDQRAPRRQPHLAVERLLELLLHVVELEQRQRLGGGVVELDPVGQMRGHRGHVLLHLLIQARVVDDHPAVVLGELLADQAHRDLGLPVQQGRGLGPLGQGLDLIPLARQSGDVALDLRRGHALGCGAHYQPVPGRADLVDHIAQAPPLAVGEALGDPVGGRVRHQHHEPARQRHLLGEAGPLVGYRVLHHLAQDRLLLLQQFLDPGLLAAAPLDLLGVVLHVAPVEHGVLGRADVDEGRLHARQHVLDPAQVDVGVDLAHVVGRPGHPVLHEPAAFEDGDLGGLVGAVDAHEVAAHGPALADPAPPLLHRLVVEFHRLVGGDGRDRKSVV